MKKVFVYAWMAALIISGCKSMNNTQKGTAIGAGAGAGVGAAAGSVIGGKNGTAIGAIIGAAVGGTGGYLIGRNMDKQAKEIKQKIPDAQVERVGEGINVTFNSALLFKINSSTLSDSAMAGLDKVAEVFVKYPETNILVEGHTDDTGTDAFNMQLSEKRAEAVTSYLESKGVAANRFTIKWYGETQPKYPNTSEANRVLNRRVELAIIANEEMKKDAKDGSLDSAN
ncbi:OmpA family protein [Parafilimonas sp.]|jgi:outer membrane protein OmpA-like peptidoglycan-associated protein|uniref:OmpA family protein n=1 Tax=Parafilimonas sp. TaxID=1969739 RepID=UPI003F7DC9A8